MEQKHITCGSSVCDRLPTMSVKYPWLVAQNPEAEEDDTKDQIFFTMHDPMSHYYRCRIPELLGKLIRGYFHGWVILSNHRQNIMWSLWNPVTSKMICLPPLVLKDGNFESINQCCLSSPPGEPTSVLILTRTKIPSIVFFHLDGKRERIRWMEMTYAKQLRSIGGGDGFLDCLTCCNGHVYALNYGARFNYIAIQVDIVVIKDEEVVISLSAFANVPNPFCNCTPFVIRYLKGHGTDLFYIKIGLSFVPKETIGAAYLFKLDWDTMIWKEMHDLKDAIFFSDLARNFSVSYRDAVSSKLGGYVHFLGKTGKVIYSYDVKEKTITISSMPCLEQSTCLSLWECELDDDHGEIEPEDEMMVRPVRDDNGVDINNTSTDEEPHHLDDIPLDLLRMIIELCVGVEYLNFRATCKRCQLAAPVIQWSNETSLRRLQTYSSISPWLTVFDPNRGIITFTDPMFGNNYFIKTPQKLIGKLQIYCSRHGWFLLLKHNGVKEMFFYNPFKLDIRELPNVPRLDSFCFSAPPTSPNCMVVGLSASRSINVMTYSLNSESSSWTRFRINFGGTAPDSFLFSTFYADCVFALNQGALEFFLKKGERNSFRKSTIVAEPPRGRGSSSSQYFLVSCDQHLLLVVMDEFEEFVEVFKPNDSTQEWEKVDSLGSHMIFICGTTCLCMEAKTPEMENKIYFPRVHSKSGKIVFYSLETRRYHTFSGRNIEHCLGAFFETKYHVFPTAWIEPSWS